MVPIVYRSSDVGAPILTGEVGSLKQVLLACLVNGYGAKPGAGWTMPYEALNKAMFRNASVAPCYLRVDDNAPGAGLAREARVVGAVDANGIDSYSLPFPTTVQAASGLFVRKSNNADNGARSWYIYADNLTFTLFTFPLDVSTVVASSLHFGEFYSYLTNNSRRHLLIAKSQENVPAAVDSLRSIAAAPSSSTTGHYLSGNYAGAGASTSPGKQSTIAWFNSAAITFGNLPMPNNPDGSVQVGRVLLSDPSPVVALLGELRGVWATAHAVNTAAIGDSFTARGRNFDVAALDSSGGAYIMETTEWGSN